MHPFLATALAVAVATPALAGCLAADEAGTAPIDDTLVPANATITGNETGTEPARANATSDGEEARSPHNASAPEPAPPAPAPAPAAPPRPRLTVHVFNGTLAAALADKAVGPDDQDTSSYHELVVPVDTTRLVATLTWNATGVDLDAVVSGPQRCERLDGPFEVQCALANRTTFETDPGTGWFRNDAGTPAEPDSPSVVELDAVTLLEQQTCDEPPCTWWLVPFAKPAIDTPYTFRVELYRG